MNRLVQRPISSSLPSLPEHLAWTHPASVTCSRHAPSDGASPDERPTTWVGTNLPDAALVRVATAPRSASYSIPAKRDVQPPKPSLADKLEHGLTDSFKMMAKVKGAVTGFAAGASAFSMLTAATGTAVALGAAGSLLGLAAAGVGLGYLGAKLGGKLAEGYLSGVERLAQGVERFTGSKTLARTTSAAAKILPMAVGGDFVAVTFTNGANMAVSTLAVFAGGTALGMMDDPS